MPTSVGVRAYISAHGSRDPYQTAQGKRYRVRYRTPDHRQTDKRGFRTKREAELFAATVEVARAKGEYVAPSLGRVTLGSCPPTGWPVSARPQRRATTACWSRPGSMDWLDLRDPPGIGDDRAGDHLLKKSS